VVRSLTLAFSLLFLIATVAAADELRGRVTDPQGQPVRHANVLVMRGGVVIATATTTMAGQFGPLTLPAGDYEVTVSAPWPPRETDAGLDHRQGRRRPRAEARAHRGQ
jgi:hypothetical protein